MIRHSLLALAALTLLVTTASAQHHFTDAERRIITLVDEQRATDSVAMYLGDKNPDVAWRAAVGLANLRDTTARLSLIAALRSETRDTVRNAVAFALGILGPNANAATALAEATHTHSSLEVSRALGRVMDASGAEAYCAKMLHNEPALTREARPFAAMLVELGLRQVYTPTMGSLIDLLAESNDPEVRWRAAYVYGRAKDSAAVAGHLPALRQLLEDQGSEYARMFAASSIARISSPESIQVLENALRSEPAWRVRVNLFNGLARAPYFDSMIFAQLRRAVDEGVSDNPVAVNLATTALRAVQQMIIAGKFSSADSQALGSWLGGYNGMMPEHNDVAKLVQATASVLAAQLLVPNRAGIENFAQMKDYVLRNLAIEGASFVPDTFYFAGILASMPLSSPKEQLNRLEGLGNLWQLAKKDPPFMAQLERMKLADIYRHLVIHISELVTEPEVVIPAISAWSDSLILNSDTLRSEAAALLPRYVRAFTSTERRDQLVATVSAIMAVSRPHESVGSPDLMTALEGAAKLAVESSDKELLDSLQHAYAVLGAPWPGYRPAPRHSDINWKELESLKNSLIVNFTRDILEIDLYPYYAPLTVLKMVRLARIQFFANQAFHRIVPNFVIQSGDPTGSGWGGPGYMMRTEIAPIAYDEEGMVGMASSGLNTEGSQWFITECPTPHLSTKYTIWGKVHKGMDKVFKVQPGEKLETIQPFNR
jgi:cyclophilin family peptidyl-prolyl cis-trans isomerase/HEAT repeat protein